MDEGIKKDNAFSERMKELKQESQENNAKEEAIINQAVAKILNERDPEYIKMSFIENINFFLKYLMQWKLPSSILAEKISVLSICQAY